MKVVYISETSLSNKSAQTIHVVKMCDAFCNKSNVDLLIPYCANQEIKNLKKDFLLTSKKIFIKYFRSCSQFFVSFAFGYKTASTYVLIL